MKTLIIYAHPKHKGHCSAFLDETIKQLKEKNQDYELIDLYKIKYDPVLHPDEHYTSGGRKVSKQNKEFQDKISKTNKIIFIYPVWWNSMPAILKGWFDRVFTNHFSFKYVNKPILSTINKGPVPEGLLKGKKSVIFVTSGAKKWQADIFLRNRFKKIISVDILKFCGIKSKVFHLAACTSDCKLREKEIKKIVRKGLKYLE